MEETRRMYIKISSQRMRMFQLDPTALVLAGEEHFAWSIPGLDVNVQQSPWLFILESSPQPHGNVFLPYS